MKQITRLLGRCGYRCVFLSLMRFLLVRFPFQLQSVALSSEAKDAAADIECRLHLGSNLSGVVNNREDALALLNLYKDEHYILTEHDGKFCVSKPPSWLLANDSSFYGFSFFLFFFFFVVHANDIFLYVANLL